MQCTLVQWKCNNEPSCWNCLKDARDSFLTGPSSWEMWTFQCILMSLGEIWKAHFQISLKLSVLHIQSVTAYLVWFFMLFLTAFTICQHDSWSIVLSYKAFHTTRGWQESGRWGWRPAQWLFKLFVFLWNVGEALFPQRGQGVGSALGRNFNKDRLLVLLGFTTSLSSQLCSVAPGNSCKEQWIVRQDKAGK